MGTVRARGKGPRGGRRSLPWLVATAVMISASAAFAAPLALSSQNLTVYRTCYLTPTTTNDAVETDSYVDQSKATTNNGTATTFLVQSSGTKTMRAYIRFDLTLCSPALPSIASAIAQATLRLYVFTYSAVCRTYDTFLATASWTETGITWNNQPTVGASATSQIAIGPPGCQNDGAAGYLVNGWNVTTDVGNFVSGTSTNYGWMIRDDVEGGTPGAAAGFASKENISTAPSMKPQLIITYQT